MILLRVETHWCVAGGVFEDGVCTKVAPIFKWWKGKSFEIVMHHINQRKWKYQVMEI